MLRKGFLSFFTIERRRKFITGFILAMAVYSILLKFLNLIPGIGRYHSCDIRLLRSCCIVSIPFFRSIAINVVITMRRIITIV